MRILIIEDELPAVERLRRFVHNFNPSFEIIDSLDSVQEALDWFEQNLNPDLIFLDIHLSDGNSFEILRKTGITCPVIFTTSHAEYVANAFEAFAIDYLFKPIKRDAFTRAMNRFLQRRPSGNKVTEITNVSDQVQELSVLNPVETTSRILVKIGQQLKVLDLNEAAYYLYETRLTLYVSEDDKKYPVDHSLDQLEKILDPGRFFRINRQCILNYRQIGQILTYSKSRLKIILPNKTRTAFDVSADRTTHFKQWLLQSGEGR